MMNWILFGFNLIGITFWVFFMLRKLRRETFIIILNKDRSVNKIKVINPSEKTFESDKKTYNIVGSDNNKIHYRRKDVIIFEYGKADSINVLDKQNSRIDADTLYSLLHNTEIIKMNQSSNPFFNIEPKFLILIAIIGVGLFIAYTGGFFG